MQNVSTERLRRIALDRQGLLKRAPFGRGRAAVLGAIRHLGYLQLDTISVVVRAHHHIMRTRVPNYRPGHLDRLVADREIFEYRFPIAAYRPMEDFRFMKPFFEKWRERGDEPAGRDVMEHVLRRIETEGSLCSRDFEDPREGRRQWWDWKPAKRALELLYRQGDLMISARDAFEKYYDLTERVLPAGTDVTPPTDEEYGVYLVDAAMTAHGFASLKTVTGRGRGLALGRAVRAELDRRTSEGALELAKDGSGGRIWIDPSALARRMAKAPLEATILSPFDNAVTERERLLRCFGFDYLIECFVPEAERRYGYFCLPVLYGDRLVCRMDCKAHRDEARFEVIALFLEDEVDAALRRELAGPLARALVEFAAFDSLEEVTVTRCSPGAFRGELTKALRVAGV